MRTHLLHDAGLALREGDVATRLVLDELDLNLPTLAAGLVVVVIVVVGGRTRALGAAVDIALDEGAVVAGAVVVDGGRRVLVVVGDLRGHYGGRELTWLLVFGLLSGLTACGLWGWDFLFGGSQLGQLGQLWVLGSGRQRAVQAIAANCEELVRPGQNRGG
jgi:hypothetical protein